MAREPLPPWRSLFFLLPVPLQVIRSRDSFTPRTTGIQLLSAVVLEETISSCRKQFDIQHKRKTVDDDRRKRSWRYQRPNKHSKPISQEISKILQDYQYQWSYCWNYYCCYRERRALSLRSEDIQGTRTRFGGAVEKEVRHTKRFDTTLSPPSKKFYWRPLRFGFLRRNYPK